MRQYYAYVQILVIALFMSACGKAEFGTNGGSSSAKGSAASSSSVSTDENGDSNGQIHDVGDLVEDPALADQYACGNKNEKKVLICHVPPGNSAAAHTICVGAAALDAHMSNHEATDGAHDTLGECPAVAQVADQGVSEEGSHGGGCKKKK